MGKRKGFTLVELIVACAVIFTLVAVLIGLFVPTDLAPYQNAAQTFVKSKGGDVDSLMCSYDQEDREYECMFQKGTGVYSIECSQFGCGGVQCLID